MFLKKYEENLTMLIINADDFGKDHNVNTAILECFNKKMISSASIMANMPGFDEACKIAEDYDLTHLIGVHLVLTEGVPLTEGIKNTHFCSPDGHFILTRKKRLLCLNKKEKDVIATEIKNQIEKCKRFNLPLTHLDSHHHIHEEWAVLRLILPLLSEYKIPHIRILNNMNTSSNRLKRIYRSLINRYLISEKISRSHYFGTRRDYDHFSQLIPMNLPDKPIEIVIHPTLDQSGRVIDAMQ
jgi:hypothetical protein